MAQSNTLIVFSRHATPGRFPFTNWAYFSRSCAFKKNFLRANRKNKARGWIKTELLVRHEQNSGNFSRNLPVFVHTSLEIPLTQPNVFFVNFFEKSRRHGKVQRISIDNVRVSCRRVLHRLINRALFRRDYWSLVKSFGECFFVCARLQRMMLMQSSIIARFTYLTMCKD